MARRPLPWVCCRRRSRASECVTSRAPNNRTSRAPNNRGSLHCLTSLIRTLVHVSCRHALRSLLPPYTQRHGGRRQCPPRGRPPDPQHIVRPRAAAAHHLSTNALAVLDMQPRRPSGGAGNAARGRRGGADHPARARRAHHPHAAPVPTRGTLMLTPLWLQHHQPRSSTAFSETPAPVPSSTMPPFTAASWAASSPTLPSWSSTWTTAWCTAAPACLTPPSWYASPLLDTVTHTMQVDGHLYQLDQHLQRFARSAEMARLTLPVSLPQIRRIILETTAASLKQNGTSNLKTQLVCGHWIQSRYMSQALCAIGCPAVAATWASTRSAAIVRRCTSWSTRTAARSPYSRSDCACIC